eukprot:466989-Amphidinium_carterae.1
MESSFVEGQSLESYHVAYCLSDILLSLPQPSRQHEPKKKTGGAQSSGTSATDTQSPWIAQLQQHVAGKREKKTVRVADGEEQSLMLDEEAEEKVPAFMSELEEFDRQRLEEFVPPWPEHFTTALLGGAWQLERTGRE